MKKTETEIATLLHEKILKIAKSDSSVLQRNGESPVGTAIREYHAFLQASKTRARLALHMGLFGDEKTAG